MKTIGIAGGVGSGKSFVAGCLELLGAARFDADKAAHEELQQSEVRQAIRGRWADAPFDAEGRVDRKRLAEIVFAADSGSAAERAWLEQLVHPGIRRRLEETRQKALDRQAPALVIDAALLFEAGWHEMCNTVLFVDAPEEIRRGRAAERGWSEKEWKLRETSQLPLEEKRRRADFCLDNSGTPEAVESQLRIFWDSLFGGDVSN